MNRFILTGIFCFLLAFGVGFNFAFAAWNEPGSSPPLDNVAAPLNQETPFIGDWVSGAWDSGLAGIRLNLATCAADKILKSNGSAWVCSDFSGSQNLLLVLNAGANASAFSGNVYIGDASHAANVYFEGGELKAKWLHATAAGNNSIAGNLGIGTTGPSGNLDVYNSSVATQYVRSDNSALRIVSTGGVNYVQSGAEYNVSNSRADLRFTSMYGAYTFMAIQGNTGNVGIGTWAPTEKLHVSGARSKLNNILIGEVSSGFDLIQSLGSSGLRLTTLSGAGNLYIHNSGNVSIGTNAVSGSLRLDINGNVGANQYCDENGNNCKTMTQLGASQTLLDVLNTGADASNYAGTVNIGNGGHAANFYVNGGEIGAKWLHATAAGNNSIAGNLGIGTTGPSGNLDVYNSSVATQYVRSDNSALRIVSTGGVNYVQSGASYNTSDSRADLRFTSMYGAATFMAIQGSTGNVGIGTTVPGAKLQINPPASTEGLRIVSASNYSPLNIRNNANSADIFRVDQSGILQVGSIPWGRLTSFPAACPSGQYVTGVGGTLTCATPAGGGASFANPTASIGLTAVNGSATTAMRSDAAPALSQAIAPSWTGVHTFNNTVNLPGSGIWNTSGNVGIGDTSPGAKLEIATNNAGAKLYLTDGFTGGKTWELQSGIPGVSDAYFGIKNVSDGVQALTIANGGNVGIGTSNPGAKLEIAGQVKITGGSPGLNKVLTSDANGLASWATPVAGGVTSISNSDGTLTINPTSGAVVASLNRGHANTWSGAQTFSANTNFPGSGIWNTSGNVGIGTVSPNKQLHIKTASGNAEIDIQSANSPYWGIYQDDATNDLRFWNTANRLTITNIGNVGIGVTSPAITLAVGDTDSGIDWGGDGVINFMSNNIITMNIEEHHVYIGDLNNVFGTSPSLQVSGPIGAEKYCDEQGGNCITPGTKTWVVGDQCGLYINLGGPNRGRDADVPCQGSSIYIGGPNGDRSVPGNFSCPTGFEAVGGDFGSAGDDRYWWTCIKI